MNSSLREGGGECGEEHKWLKRNMRRNRQKQERAIPAYWDVNLTCARATIGAES